MEAPTASRDYQHTLICASNLRELAIAIAGYAKEHGGKLPENLEDLPRYPGSDRMHFCPSAKDQTHYSYVLTGATNVWGVSTNTIIVLEIQPNHYGKRNALFDDGHIELKAASEF